MITRLISRMRSAGKTRKKGVNSNRAFRGSEKPWPWCGRVLRRRPWWWCEGRWSGWVTPLGCAGQGRGCRRHTITMPPLTRRLCLGPLPLFATHMVCADSYITQPRCHVCPGIMGSYTPVSSAKGTDMSAEAKRSYSVWPQIYLHKASTFHRFPHISTAVISGTVGK